VARVVGHVSRLNDRVGRAEAGVAGGFETTIWSFVLEPSDSSTPPIPVELRARNLSGSPTEGQEIEVEVPESRDVLHPLPVSSVIDTATRSIVGVAPKSVLQRPMSSMVRCDCSGVRDRRVFRCTRAPARPLGLCLGEVLPIGQ
jgi:hypothetical protein